MISSTELHVLGSTVLILTDFQLQGGERRAGTVAFTLNSQLPSSLSPVLYLHDFFFPCRHFTLLATEGAFPKLPQIFLVCIFYSYGSVIGPNFLKELKFALEASDGVVRLSNVFPN